MQEFSNQLNLWSRVDVFVEGKQFSNFEQRNDYQEYADILCYGVQALKFKKEGFCLTEDARAELKIAFSIFSHMRKIKKDILFDEKLKRGELFTAKDICQIKILDLENVFSKNSIIKIEFRPSVLI
ncbi:MAG: hypothetical protein KDD56_03515 [Bdellovibrionales bacterium]|nr:hypothetical protein [Bdellovibrionales bacterium]